MRKTLYLLVRPFVVKFCPERYHCIEIDQILPNSGHRLKMYGFNRLKNTKSKWYDKFLSQWRNLSPNIILEMAKQFPPSLKAKIVIASWHDPERRKLLERQGIHLTRKSYG